MIENMPTPKGKAIEDLRGAFEHRATWFYFLIEEARKQGLSLDFARKAIFNCGCFHGEGKFPQTEDLKEFTAAFANENVKEIFEMDVNVTDDELTIEFHYCPLVAAWKKLTDDEELIAELCDIAMEGDRGIASKYDAFEFYLGETIAKGNKVCQVSFKKVQK